MRKQNLTLWIALLLGFFILISATSAMLSPNQEQEILTNRSVYNPQPSGIRGWYLTVQKSGLPVSLWKKPFDQLDELPKPSIMLIVEPYSVGDNRIVFSRRELAPLLDWVSKGNTLIFLDEFRRPTAKQLLSTLELNLKQPAPMSQQQKKPVETPTERLTIASQRPMLKNYLQQPLVSTSRTGVDFKAAPGDPSWNREVILENARHQPALLKIRHGYGWIYAGTTADLVSNAYLFKPENDNFQFLSNLIAEQQRPLFINEFVHGYVEAADIFAYYQQKTPLGKVFLQFLFGFVFVLWLSFLPWRPRQLLRTTREALSDSKQVDLKAFIESMAGIFYKTRSAPLAVEPQLNKIATLLRRRYHVQLFETARVERLLTSHAGRYSNKDESPEALLQALRKATEVVEKQQHLPHRELLRLVQQLILIEEQLASHGYPGRITGTTRTGSAQPLERL